ncbi:MAG TPA: AAA family ATPase [Candidatus Baltobacteraceae bacterium]|nr:AAA family ATPase [Candidatus Baltobacteraceae bacterium]
MIIESIALEGVRHFRNRVEIGGFQPGLNVLVAPNGTGKSTLIDGLVASLVQSYKTQGDKISTLLRHVAHDLTPVVEVTLKRNDGRYRVRKAFLKGGYAKLERDEGGEFVAIADGEEVEAWLDKALALDRPGAGVAKPEQYGLGAVLWARQSDPALGKLPTAQEQHLRSLIAPGSATISVAESCIREAIEERFRHYWEPKGKNHAKGQLSANIPELEQAAAQARERQERASEAIQLVLEQRRAFDEISTRLSIRNTKRGDRRRRVDELKSVVDRVRDLDHQIELAEQNAIRAAAELARVSKERDSLIEAQDRIKALDPQMLALDESAAQITARITEAEATIERALGNQDRAHKESTAIAAEEARVADARSFLLANEALGEFERRLETIAELRILHEEAIRKVAAVIAPDDDDWNALIKARDAQREAHQRVESESLTLRFTPEQDVTLLVRSGSPEGERLCKAGTEVLINGLGTIDVEIPDIGALRFSSPMESAAKLRDALNAATEALSALVAPYGNASIETLESRRAERGIYNGKLADIESRLGVLLSGEEPDALIAALESRRAKRHDLLDRYPEWAAGLPDPEALATQIEPRREAAVLALATANATIEAQQAQRKELLAGREQVQQEQQSKHLEIARYRNVINLAESENLPEKIKETGLLELQATARRDDLRKQRAEISGDPVGEYESIQKSIEQLSADIEKDQGESARLRATLETNAGAYETFAVAKADFETAERRRTIAERAAKAVKLLHDQIVAASRAIAEAVNAPLAANATTFVRRIMSRDDVRIGFHIDDKAMMQLSFSTTAWNGKTISDTISGGEQEQIEVAMRLAMGSLLAKDEPQVVILDDALTFCDPVRLYRILEVLAEAEQDKLQVILTGCDPDRYASMPKGAHRIDLDALLRRSSVA